MLFLEFASVGPMLGQADISTLAQRRTNGWITIGMFTGRVIMRFINISNNNNENKIITVIIKIEIKKKKSLG